MLKRFFDLQRRNKGMCRIMCIDYNVFLYPPLGVSYSNSDTREM